MTGWIINLEHTAHCRQEERAQLPVFYFDDGSPCFEIWFWHVDLYRWFVMSYARDPRMEAQRVVYFHPDETADHLRARFESLAS